MCRRGLFKRAPPIRAIPFACGALFAFGGASIRSKSSSIARVGDWQRSWRLRYFVIKC